MHVLSWGLTSVTATWCNQACILHQSLSLNVTKRHAVNHLGGKGDECKKCRWRYSLQGCQQATLHQLQELCSTCQVNQCNIHGLPWHLRWAIVIGCLHSSCSVRLNGLCIQLPAAEWSHALIRSCHHAVWCRCVKLKSKTLRAWHVVNVLQQIASWCLPYSVISKVSC